MGDAVPPSVTLMNRRFFIGLYLAISVAAINTVSTAAPLPIPAGDIILKTLNPAHPRLLAAESDFARLRGETQTNALLKSWFQRLEQKAEGILKQPPSRYEIPDGLRLLATSRRVLDRVYLLAMMYRITHDSRFANRAWGELDAAARFPDWNHAKHFLDTAEMTHAFAIGYDWLYDVWTPEQRESLRAAMVVKGLEPGLVVLRKGGWWSVAKHNWNQVCNGGLAMGALAMADAKPELAGELLSLALASIQIPMAEFAPDGAWGEGPGYWDYATSYNVTLLAALDSALGADFGLSTLPGFSETGAFPLYLNGPSKRAFNFADGGDHQVRGAQLFWLGRKFDRPEFSAFERTTPDPDAQDLLWFDPRGDAAAIQRLPLDKLYRKTGLAVFRSDWRDPDAVYVGLKAGGNAVNHSHLDLGSFVLDALGERWAIDFGHEDYNLPGYFGKARWTYYRLRAEGHNTLLLNPGFGPDQAPRAEARIVRFESRAERAFAIADLTPAYAPHAANVRRGIALLDRKEVLVQDEIQAATAADIWWFMHTTAELRGEGRVAVLKIGDKQLTARILAPDNASFAIMKAEPLASSPNPANQTSNDKFLKLAVHLPAVKDLRLAILFTPGPVAESARSVEPLEKW
jgi:hypothetical protein